MTIGFTIAGATPEDAVAITDSCFGARYVSFRGFNRFDEALEQTHIGMVVWPGGTMAEKNPERFGFEYDGLYNSEATGDKPGLHEMMAHCVEHGLDLTVTLPTARYVDNPDLLRAHLGDFLDDLYSGGMGTLPDKLIFEVGNEFYGVFDGATEAEQAAAYAEVVNVYADVVLEKEAEYDLSAGQVDWSVQLGRSTEATEAMLDALDDDSILMADSLVHHRFAITIDAADKVVGEVDASLDLWEAEADDLGIDRPDLSLSAFNTASLSRVEAANNYLNTEEGHGLTMEDLDLTGRSHTDFEAHYQEMLDYRAYGLEQGENILQMFSEYSALGTTSSGIYGWDLTHAGRLSYEGEDGQSYVFAPGSLQDMMAESLEGTRVLDWYDSNSATDDTALSAYGFDSDDKLVMFLVAPEDFGGEDSYEVDLSLLGLGDVKEVWGESLTSETPDDWHSLFNVPEVDGVDQSAEAETYALGVRDSFAPKVDGETMALKFTQESQIIRLTFARTDEAADEIASWHGDESEFLDIDPSLVEEEEELDLESHAPLPEIPIDEAEEGLDDTPDEGDGAVDGGEDGGGAAGMAGLLTTMLLGLMGMGI